MAQMLASPCHGAEIQVLRVHLAVDTVASGVGDDAQLGLRRPARVAPTSSQGLEARGLREQRAHAESICRKIGSQAGTVSFNGRRYEIGKKR
jgi:hypothetical protein